MLVRGFGLADRNLPDDSRIVILLEEIGHRQAHKDQPMPVFCSKSLCAVPRNQQDPDPKTVVADVWK